MRLKFRVRRLPDTLLLSNPDDKALESGVLVGCFKLMNADAICNSGRKESPAPKKKNASFRRVFLQVLN